MQEISQKELFVLDMDGTFYLSDRLIDGSKGVLDAILRGGKNFMFFTNNSSRSRDSYIEKLSRMGVNINKDRLMTSGDVMISYLKRFHCGKTVYLMGTDSLTESFREAGITLTDEHPNLVVLGYDTTLTYDKIMKAARFIMNGTEFLCTHPDVNCPTADGPIPDCGAMISLFETSTGVRPKIVGKPFTETVDAITQRTGISRDRLMFCGDRLATDIAIGFNHGITTALVLTGVTTKGELDASAIKPTYVFDSLKDIVSYL